MDKPTFLPGTLTLIADANVKEMNIALDIPHQVITLTGYRVEMSSAANALSEKIIYLDIPKIYNVNKVLDNNFGHVYLPILLDNAAVTLQQSLDVPISMTNHLPERFTIRILNSSFQPVSNLVHAVFSFKISYGHSN